MTTPGLDSTERARQKAELEARRTALRIEVKAQLAGSGDDRVVGLRNRIAGRAVSLSRAKVPAVSTRQDTDPEPGSRLEAT